MPDEIVHNLVYDSTLFFTPRLRVQEKNLREIICGALVECAPQYKWNIHCLSIDDESLTMRVQFDPDLSIDDAMNIFTDSVLKKNNTLNAHAEFRWEPEYQVQSVDVSDTSEMKEYLTDMGCTCK